MKIIYLHQYFNTPQMSGGTRSYEMARRFVKAGHEVHMITSQRENHTKAKGWSCEPIDGIYVHWLNVPYSNKMSFLKRIVAFIKFSVAAGLKAVNVKGDILFATSTPLTIALPGVFASKILRIPMVFEVRDLWPEVPIAIGALKHPILKKLAYILEKFAYKNSKHIVALSSGMAEGIKKTGYSDEKISIIPNSCDLELFNVKKNVDNIFVQFKNRSVDGHLIVYAGTLGEVNGVGYLVEIAHSMKSVNPKINFLIVGDGKENSTISVKANDLGVLGDNLWILPPVSKSKIPELLSAATLTSSFVIDLPELWNNSANKFFDSLAAARPIMINYEGWQADLLRETGAGFVVPPSDSILAANILNEFVSNESTVKESEKAALQLAIDRFDRDKLAIKLLGVLEEGCHKKLV